MPQLSMHSPIGDLTIFEDDMGIIALEWGWVAEQMQTSLLDRAIDQLDAYMNGELQHFDLPLAPYGTMYQQLVWKALLDIPFGSTCSYKAISARVGGSPRSVGQANGRNPIPIIIPCHRVVAESHIGGYSAGEGLTTKQWLLVLENPNKSLFAARVTNGGTT